MNVTKVWNPRSPKMCRDFLENLYFGDKKIEECTMADGSVIKVSEATDDQCVMLVQGVMDLMEEAKR